MKISIIINEKDLKQLVVDKVSKETGRVVDINEVEIQVKSKQNYKAE